MRSAECAVLGNFTDEVTLLGVAGQITLGILDLDLPCDIRDIIADIKNLAETDRVRWDSQPSPPGGPSHTNSRQNVH